MENHNSTPPNELSEIRKQFDFSPYPATPLEHSPNKATASLFAHNLVTPYYYRNQVVIETKGMSILDAGCGSGYKSLILAEANPGARILGVDFSEKSVRLARQRLHHHGFNRAKFEVLSIEDIPALNQKFDFINCDEALYLLPDPIAGLKAMKAALNPEGILRVNFHSQLQRHEYFRAQKVSGLLGLLEGQEQLSDMDTFRTAMRSLKDEVPLKKSIWHADYENSDQQLLANHLLRGDKGFTIPEFMETIQAAGLEFVRMVDWQSWELMELFKDPNGLPDNLAALLLSMPDQERLHIYELLCPNHRLLDVWCGLPQQGKEFRPITEWKAGDWRKARVHLHPQLLHSSIRDKLRGCALTLQPFDFNEFLSIQGGFAQLDATLQACLLPLWESPQSFSLLVSHWKQLHPVNPVTLAPTHDSEAYITVKRMVIILERLGYLLIDIP